MSQVAGPFSPRVRWLLDSPVDIRMTRRRLSRGLRWMDRRARKSENLREVTDSSTLHSPYWSTRSFGNLLNPIAVRIIFVPKLSLEALRASAIRLWYQFSFFFKTVFRMGRFRNSRNHITVLVVCERFALLKVVWSHIFGCFDSRLNFHNLFLCSGRFVRVHLGQSL